MNKILNERIDEIAYTMTIILAAVAAAVLLFLLFISHCLYEVQWLSRPGGLMHLLKVD